MNDGGRADAVDHDPANPVRTRTSNMTSKDYTLYKPVSPYFELVRGALGTRVDGEHFFDCVAEDIVYEVLYDFPGWPRIIEGRTELMARFSGYGKYIEIHTADHLIKHASDQGQVMVIEYQVHGTILASHVEYNNRFCSIIKIENRRIAHWRDYMDSLAAWNALSAGAPE
jgi:ketosteroid isomerase-like protein